MTFSFAASDYAYSRNKYFSRRQADDGGPTLEHTNLACKTTPATFRPEGSAERYAVQRALDLTPDDDPDVLIRLDNLATLLHTRYQRSGDIQDLQADVMITQRVLGLTPRASVTHKQQAVELTPQNHPAMPRRLHNLASSLHAWYDHTGNIQDLHAAVTPAQRTLDLTPQNHTDMQHRLGGLGVLLHSRYECAGVVQDLDNAITHKQGALDLTPHGHPDMPRWLHMLASSLHARYQRTGDARDFHTKTLHIQRAFELTPRNHLDMPTRLNRLATSLHGRHEQTGDMQDLHASSCTYRKW